MYSNTGLFHRRRPAPRPRPRWVWWALTAIVCGGGALYVRDHGRYDLTHLRAPARVAGDLHRRADGTLCYFFDPPGLAAAAEGAGFRVVECKWVTVERPNRRTGAVLRRVFVSGVFVKE